MKKQVKRLTSIQRKADVPPYAERTRSEDSNKESLSFGNFLSKRAVNCKKEESKLKKSLSRLIFWEINKIKYIFPYLSFPKIDRWFLL